MVRFSLKLVSLYPCLGAVGFVCLGDPQAAKTQYHSLNEEGGLTAGVVAVELLDRGPIQGALGYFGDKINNPAARWPHPFRSAVLNRNPQIGRNLLN